MSPTSERAQGASAEAAAAEVETKLERSKKSRAFKVRWSVSSHVYACADLLSAGGEERGCLEALAVSSGTSRGLASTCLFENL